MISRSSICLAVGIHVDSCPCLGMKIGCLLGSLGWCLEHVCVRWLLCLDIYIYIFIYSLHSFLCTESRPVSLVGVWCLCIFTVLFSLYGKYVCPLHYLLKFPIDVLLIFCSLSIRLHHSQKSLILQPWMKSLKKMKYGVILERARIKQGEFRALQLVKAWGTEKVMA